MPTGYQILDQEGLYYLTIKVVNSIDIFTRKRYRDIVIQSLKYCQKYKALEIYAYIVMSNHLHMVVRSSTGNLSDTIGEFKSFTSKAILHAIETSEERRKTWILPLFAHAATLHKRNTNYQLWTHENRAIVLLSNKFITQKINYIHKNPVKAGIVEKPEDYIYSSARNYAGLEGLIDVDVVTFKWLTIK
jgi:REP element-mobilizing transposase RayT